MKIPDNAIVTVKRVKGKNFSCNNTGKRKKSDYYETPYSITNHILNREQLILPILEPACGSGAIVKVLHENGYYPTYYDIDKNFFTETAKFETVITNPPYSQAFEFTKKAKEIATSKIMFLLPLSYLHGKKRLDYIYSDNKFPLKCIYVFCRYPMLGEKLRQDGKYNTGMMVYAWFVWDKGYEGEPIIRWIDNNDDVLRSKLVGEQPNEAVKQGGE